MSQSIARLRQAVDIGWPHIKVSRTDLREVLDLLDAAEKDAGRLQALLRNNGREFNVSTPGQPHVLNLRLVVEGCECYLPDGAFDFPGTIRAVLDDEIRLQATALFEQAKGAQP